MYSVYILQSTKDTRFYTGTTENLNARLIEHNSGRVASTRLRAPLELRWHCIFRNKYKALEFEKYLKSGSGHAFVHKHLLP